MNILPIRWPGPIYSPEIEDVEPSSFRLSWRSPSVSKPTTYAIETLEPSTWKWRPLVSRLPHPSYKVTNVTPGTDYAFRVRAEVDSVITEPSLPISFSNRRGKLILHFYFLTILTSFYYILTSFYYILTSFYYILTFFFSNICFFFAHSYSILNHHY